MSTFCFRRTVLVAGAQLILRHRDQHHETLIRSIDLNGVYGVGVTLSKMAVLNVVSLWLVTASPI
ncbi:MAG: hypothetical protein K0Q55_568 [Verrucomicrobia bacterium]|jgi:hypothetical protein|nr:hypothetical protein [Verrucomicrobiota bacterium]